METDREIRVLFLCTANSARSQMAEALLKRASGGRFVAGSAGSHPGGTVHPDAIATLAERGIDWSGSSKGIDQVASEGWDVVITVCDHAREHCPILPGTPIQVHWGIPDPAAVAEASERKQAFHEAANWLEDRIGSLVALPWKDLDARDVAHQLDALAAAE